MLVESQLKLDPFSAQLFAFRNRRATAVKVLYGERNGFCLWQKRLEKERFHWPPIVAGGRRDDPGWIPPYPRCHRRP